MKPLFRKLHDNTNERIERLHKYQSLLESQCVHIVQGNIQSLRGHIASGGALVLELEGLQRAYTSWRAIALEQEQGAELVGTLQRKSAPLFEQVQALQGKSRELLRRRLQATAAELADLRIPSTGRARSTAPDEAALIDVHI